MVRARDLIATVLVLAGVVAAIVGFARCSSDEAVTVFDQVDGAALVVGGLLVCSIAAAYLAARHSREPPPRGKAPELPRAQAKERDDS